jgi:hypothetical protein
MKARTIVLTPTSGKMRAKLVVGMAIAAPSAVHRVFMSNP